MAAMANRATSVEFIVKPKQDLHLEGSLRSLARVTKGEQYPCQMQKNQAFSCLFRHYAKHNGLRKEDLVFTFVDELLPDQTPETVHLMPQDEIWVEHRIPDLTETKPVVATSAFSEHFRQLLEGGQHADVSFLVGEAAEEVVAHKAILSARSEYFNAMFRVGGMAESRQNSIRLEHVLPVPFRRLLEFLYTDTVRDIDALSANDVLALLSLSQEFVVQNLRELCERSAAKVISRATISKFLLMTAGSGPSVLRSACARFVQDNMSALALDNSFRLEVESCPELGLLLFEASLPVAVESPERGRPGFESNKRRRVTHEPNNAEIEPDSTNTIAQTNANVQDF